MDIVLYNVEFQTHVVLPIRFETLLTSPFARIVDLSRELGGLAARLFARAGPR